MCASPLTQRAPKALIVFLCDNRPHTLFFIRNAQQIQYIWLQLGIKLLLELKPILLSTHFVLNIISIFYHTIREKFTRNICKYVFQGSDLIVQDCIPPENLAPVRSWPRITFLRPTPAISAPLRSASILNMPSWHP